MELHLLTFYIVIALLLIIVISILAYHVYFWKYYKYLKIHHRRIWLTLLNKDPLVREVGDWIRGFGSIYLLLSIFRIREDYGDPNIKKLKKKTLVSLLVFLFCFALLSIVPFILSKVSSLLGE